jgi:cytochrome oxidase Cu insertion factor (SCO1/SenC/PrrC family)
VRPPRLGRRAITVLIAAAVAAGAAGGVLAAQLRPHPGLALPAYHGEMSWSAAQRPAPGFRLRDQRGSLVSLSGLHGHTVLLTFLDSRCTSDCPLEARGLALVLHGLPAAVRPTLVIVSVDSKGDTAKSIDAAVQKWGLAGPWTWHWVNGSPASLAAVWRAYGIAVRPTSHDIVHGMALYLIDRAGDERTGYLFPFLPGFLTSDLEHLARESV